MSIGRLMQKLKAICENPALSAEDKDAIESVIKIIDQKEPVEKQDVLDLIDEVGKDFDDYVIDN